jgi:hypothetical protein
MDQGWIPYSVKIGDKYFSYREWPTALMMAGLGSYYDANKYNDSSKDSASRLAMAVAATGKFALTSSWISSVSSVLNTLDAENYQSAEKSLFNVAGSTAGALVPFNQSTLKLIDKIFDPESYPPSTLQGALMSQVAFARRFDNANEPALNALGDPIHVNPIQAFYGATTEDPTWSALGRLNLFVPTATKSERINNRPITSDEYYSLIQQAGQQTKTALESGGLETMEGMPQEQAQEYLNDLYRSNIRQIKSDLESQAIGSGEAPVAKPKRVHR